MNNALLKLLLTSLSGTLPPKQRCFRRLPLSEGRPAVVAPDGYPHGNGERRPIAAIAAGARPLRRSIG